MPSVAITFDGEIVDGDAELDSVITVEEILENIRKELAVDESSLSLIFNGKELNPTMTLEKCGVGNGARIFVTDNLKSTFSNTTSEPYDRSTILGPAGRATRARAHTTPILHGSGLRINTGSLKNNEYEKESIENKNDHESALLLEDKYDERDERARNISKMRSCSAKCTDFFYRWRRLGLFREVFSIFFLKIIMYLDIGALLLCASYMRDIYPTISGLMLLLVAAPFIATWASGLILCERFKLQLHYRQGTCQVLAKLLLPFYLFFPSGIVLIVVADLLQWLSQMGAVIARWLCGRVKEEEVVNTSWVQAFPRQRRNFHVLCQSLPEIPLLIYIITSESYVDVETTYDLIWVLSLGLGVVNFFLNLLNWKRISLNWDIGVVDYLLPTFRLFGGIIPGLHKISEGVTSLDWANFAFGQLTYIQFVELLSGANVKLESIDISSKTLMYLSENLCYHFGEMMKYKEIVVNLYAAPSAEQCFREMDEKRRGYISLSCLKKKLAATGKFKDVDKDKFGVFFKYLDEWKRVHYSQFLVSTKSRPYRELLRISDPITGRKDRCSSKFLLGLSFNRSGQIDLQQIKPDFKMVDNRDTKLLKLLDLDGELKVEDWKSIGLRLCEAICDENQERADWLISISRKCKNEAIHPFVVRDEIGNCPIHYAIMTASASIVQSILQSYHKSNSMLNKVNNEGTSALALGLASKNKEIRDIVDKYIL